MAEPDASLPAPSVPASIPYGRLKAKHADYDSDYWRRLRALYCGGKKLFHDTEVMKVLFPSHNAEPAEIWKDRCSRAHYENYGGTVIGHIVDGLFQDPLRVEREPEEVSAVYYDALMEDCSPPDGEQRSWNQLMREQVIEAFQVGTAWTLIDLPDVGPEYQPANAAEQEKIGALDAYAVPIPAEEVFNWKLDENCELEWALTCKSEREFGSILDDGSIIVETYHYYTREAWGRYEVRYHDEKMVSPGSPGFLKKPEDKDLILVSDHSVHPFSKVPLVRFSLVQLWAMDQLERVLKAHFNMSSALDWAVDRANFPQLYEFLAPELPGIDKEISTAQANPDRAKRQKRGIGYVQERGHEDRAEYLIPPTDSFTFTQERLKHLRDEIYRVLFLMALSVDNSAASIKRTAESKAQDKAAMMVILVALGKECREHTEIALTMIAEARSEFIDMDTVGMEKFDPIALSDALENAVVVETVNIPSPTFHRIHKKNLARRLLAGDAKEEDLEKIDEEIEANIIDEQFDAQKKMEQDDEKQAAEVAKLTAGAAGPGGPAGPGPGFAGAKS